MSKLGSEDPKRQSRLALANLRENRAARRDLAALHAARSHKYGEREFGSKNWYADKTGLARKLKTQAHRRQFRMGLKANMEFFNLLRIGDLRSAMTEGDSAILGNLPANTKASVAEFRKFFAVTPAIDVLKLFVPHKAEAVEQILRGIESLADFNQRLCCHLASHPALEPIHAVICDMLRSGSDFETATRTNPLAIATQAVQHVCGTPDRDATVFPKGGGHRQAQSTTNDRRQGNGRSARSGGGGGSARLRNCCFAFQDGTCTRVACVFRHVCDKCGSTAHGSSACPDSARS